MVVNLRKKRELISRILGVGANRIRFEPDKLDDVVDAITREDLRSLIKNGTIWTTKVKSTLRARAEEKLKTRRKRGIAPGSKKGKKTARTGKKELHVKESPINEIPPERGPKDRNEITRDVFWSIYKKIDGGHVRSLSHLRDLTKQSKIRT